MIEVGLTFVKTELQAYLTSKINATDGIVSLNNIALYEFNSPDSELVNKVIMSLVNIEEESTLKNNAFKKRNPLLNSIEYIDPPVHINLYILFTSTPAEIGSTYERSLIRLSHVIQFFQHNRKFETVVNIDDEEHKIQLIFELYTLTFEQINHLWGSLGGKQIPFAMYKARLVKLQELEALSAPVIEEIENNVRNL